MNKTLNARLEEVITWGVKREKIAGANVLVVRHGKEMAYAQAGYADREAGKPIARDTIFRLYSMTKPITAAACMKLVEEGKIDLCEPVSAYIPAFKAQQVWEGTRLVPAAREVTVRDLMGMTAGLTYPGEEDVPAREMAKIFVQAEKEREAGNEWDTQRMASAIASCPLAFQPGTSWRYSTCADVLGAVIEVASGRRFGDYLQEAFFAPLGMVDTAFYVPEEKQSRLAQVYQCAPEGLIPFTNRHLCTGGRYESAPAFESGGAGLCSTIDDYARFARMLLAGGECAGVRVLSRHTVDCMTRAQVRCEQMEKTWDSLLGFGYGHLMRVLENPGQAHSLGMQGEYGWDGWLGTYFANDPKNDLTILLMLQRRDAGTMEVTRRLRNVIYASLD